MWKTHTSSALRNKRRLGERLENQRAPKLQRHPQQPVLGLLYWFIRCMVLDVCSGRCCYCYSETNSNSGRERGAGENEGKNSTRNIILLSRDKHLAGDFRGLFHSSSLRTHRQTVLADGGQTTPVCRHLQRWVAEEEHRLYGFGIRENITHN